MGTAEPDRIPAEPEPKQADSSVDHDRRRALEILRKATYATPILLTLLTARKAHAVS